jgi:hypothetical protein
MARGKQHSNNKRQWRARDPDGGTVDDLAHAATFAIQPIQSTVPPLAAVGVEEGNGEDDDNEIEMDDDVDEDDSSDDEAPPSVDAGEEGDVEPDDDDDDDESDVDLAAAVAELEQRGQEEDFEKGGSSAPKTEHELDAYQTPIQELERHLKFRLTVEENDGATKFRKLTSENLSLAGQVKHFMALDRTVVVESASPNNNRNGFEDVIPVDEGSLLLMRGPTNDKNAKPSLIPLGRVFEVFGPVSRPLYTIRLASPPSSQKKKKNPKAPSMDAKLSKNDENDVDAPTAESVGVEKGDANSTQKNEDPVQKEDSGDKETPTVQEMVDDNTATVESHTTESDKHESQVVMTNENETKGAAPTNIPIDPWAPNGEYGKILAGNDPVSVYYVRDEAKLVDTSAIMRISGKGCGTSSLYFERR